MGIGVIFRHLIWVGILMLPFFTKGQSLWQLEKEKEGIKVWSRAVPESSFREIKAEMVFEGTLPRVRDVILDFKNHPKWMYRVKTCTGVVENGKGVVMHYQCAAPWPVKDRDLVSRGVIERDTPTHFLLKLKGEPDNIPIDNDYVRIPFFKYSWEINDLGSGKVKVQIIGIVDPGGSLPDWLVNLTVQEDPWNNLKNLRDRIRN